jgi:hypothetical protein
MQNQNALRDNFKDLILDDDLVQMVSSSRLSHTKNLSNSSLDLQYLQHMAQQNKA